MDYLKQYPASDGSNEQSNSPRDKRMKSMELNCYDEEGIFTLLIFLVVVRASKRSTDNPIYGWDIYVQRLGVYIQHKDTSPASPPDIESPYYESDGFLKTKSKKHEHEHRPRLESLDNGMT